MSLTDKQIDEMTKVELAKACKARGIKHGRLSLLQQRNALKANKEEPKAKEKKAREPREPRGKMAVAIGIYEKNKDKERQEILKLFQDTAKLTKAGANTYFALIRKRLKGGK